MIEVKKLSDNQFKVKVETDQGETSHEVTLDDQYWQDLTSGHISKEDLIKNAFEFLLERESNQSILATFNLKVINNYFPEFESVIKGD